MSLHLRQSMHDGRIGGASPAGSCRGVAAPAGRAYGKLTDDCQSTANKPKARGFEVRNAAPRACKYPLSSFNLDHETAGALLLVGCRPSALKSPINIGQPALAFPASTPHELRSRSTPAYRCLSRTGCPPARQRSRRGHQCRSITKPHKASHLACCPSLED